MQKRKFGITNESVSELGLGTWQFGPDWGGMDAQTSQDIMTAAVDGGINFFDTADVYGKGLSEERIGQFIKSRKEKIFIATKMGRFPTPGWPKNFRLFNFKQFIDASLTRLGVEQIDLMQIHCIPFTFLKMRELWEWIPLLKKEGKVKHFGLSVESVEEALFCLDKEGVESLQVIFNIFRQKPAFELFEQAKQKNIALIVRLPLSSGLLSGAISADKNFSPDDHRHYNRDGKFFNIGETFSGIPLTQGMQLTEELKSFVPPGMTLAQMALRFILDFDAVTTVIPGASNVRQIKENIAAADCPPLSADLHARLKDFYEAKVLEHIAGSY